MQDGRPCKCGKCLKLVYGYYYYNRLRKLREYVHGHNAVGKEHPWARRYGRDHHSYKSGGADSHIRRHIRKLMLDKLKCIKCNSTTARLFLCKVSGERNSRDPKDWVSLCHACRFPNIADQYGWMNGHLVKTS